MYADNDYKFVAVLNKKIEPGQQLMALGHMAAGLTALHQNPGELRFHCYQDADGSRHPAISHYPFIILQAANGNQIRSVRAAATEAGLLYNDFADSMIGVSAEDQLRRTRETPEAELDYFGIVLFGPAETLNRLTRKFSLYR